jgi:hypothetical protein
MAQVSAKILAESAPVVMVYMFSHVDTVFDISIAVNISRTTQPSELEAA